MKRNPQQVQAALAAFATLSPKPQALTEHKTVHEPELELPLDLSTQHQ